MTLSSSALEEKGALKDVVPSLPDDDSDPSEMLIALDLLPPDLTDFAALEEPSEEVPDELDEESDEESDEEDESDEE